MSTDCIFCKIAGGQLPASKVYEDDDIAAFLDIAPIIKGHTLVIPKKHYNVITGTPVKVLHKILTVVQKIAQAQIDGLKADGINITQANGEVAGQVVPHLHFHVIPRFKADGHSWNFPQKKYDSSEEMETFADSIRSKVRL